MREEIAESEQESNPGDTPFARYINFDKNPLTNVALTLPSTFVVPEPGECGHIDSALRIGEQHNIIERVGTTYMEIGGILVPVITVEHRLTDVLSGDSRAEFTCLLVIMIKDLPPQAPMKIRLPERAK